MTEIAEIGEVIHDGRMTRSERLLWPLKRLGWFFSRITPRLVWPGDEVDVSVSFPLLGDTDDERMQHWEKLGAAQNALFSAGIYFDGGTGFGSRDWDWTSHSLEGSINIRFCRRTPKQKRE